MGKNVTFISDFLKDGHLSIPPGIIKALSLEKGKKIKTIIETEKFNKKGFLRLFGIWKDKREGEINIYKDILKERERFSRGEGWRAQIRKLAGFNLLMADNGSVSVIIINRNGERFLDGCIESVKKQSYKRIETILIDNASTDGSLPFVQNNHKDITIIANNNNDGYSKAANTGILKSKGEYILILNPDIVLTPNFIENCLIAIKKDGKIGSVSGKLLRFKNNDTHDYIDSTGLILCQNIRRPLDRGQNQGDIGQ